MVNFFKKLALSLLITFGLEPWAQADVVYLKNGFSIECIIKWEDAETVELSVREGTIKFMRSQIERIHISTPEEKAQLYKRWELAAQEQWERKKQELEKKQAQERALELEKLRSVEFARQAGHIIVEALLNDKVNVTLLLDTGATLVVLPSSVGKKLGIESIDQEQIMRLTLADGRKINAGYMVLKSVRVQGVEAKDVDAAVILEDVQGINFQDGLLGMSFLKQFNFKVDQKNNKLILEKTE